MKTVWSLAVILVLHRVGLGASEDAPPIVPRYKEIIDRSISLDDFCKDPENWLAEDKFATWYSWQRKLRTDAEAKPEPHDFYGERFRFSVREGFGRSSNTSLCVQYKVGPLYLRDPANPYGRARDDRWSKYYSIKKIPVDLTEYNRFSTWVYIEGLQSCCVPIGLEVDYDDMKDYYERNRILSGRRYHHFTRRAVKGGEWTRIWLDFHTVDYEFRKRIRYIVLAHLWYGVQPSDDHEEIRFYWDDFKLENVANPRKYRGWGADPAVVTVNQLGYKPLSEKVAIIPATAAQSIFHVRDAKTHAVVQRGGFLLKTSLMGEFLEGDFSALDEPGRYYVQAGDRRSVDFPIADRPYREAAAAALHILAGQRSGCATHLHEEAHMDVAWDAKNGKHIDLVGGYFDAGDTRRFEHNPMCQPKFHMGVYRLLPEDDPLRAKLLDETVWCFKIVEKHWRQFQGLITPTMNYGRRCNFLTDNKIGTPDDPPFSGSPRHSMITWAGPAYVRLAQEMEGKDPELAKRALAVSRGICDRYGHWALWMNLGLYEATGEAKYLKKTNELIDHWLTCQDNRVIESRPPVSGMIALRPDFTSFINYPSERNYGDTVAALADTMEALPDRYYDLYFLLRRYADFYVKTVTPMVGPWAIPATVSYGRRPFDGRYEGRGQRLGLVDGEPYCVHYEGRHSEMGLKFPYALVRLAGALADPAVEAIAQRTMGQMVGWNPGNFSYLYGFGEDASQHIFCWYPLTKGMIGRYLNLDRHLRTDAHEIWTVTQTYANTSFAALDAPCQVQGTITTEGKPYVGDIVISTPSGREVHTLRTDGQGRYGPVHLSGGGHYTLAAGGSEHRVPAIAGARYTVNLDTRREVALAGKRLHGEIAKLVKVTKRDAPVVGRKPGAHVVTSYPVEYPFDGRLIRLKKGVPYSVEMAAKALGKAAASHTIVAHAANAKVEPAELTVTTQPGSTTDFTLTVTPLEAGRTMCMLLEIDGDHLKKWELSAIVEINQAYLMGAITFQGKPRRVPCQVVDERGKRVADIWLNDQGVFRPVVLPGGGAYRVRYRDLATEVFQAEDGKAVTIELDLKNEGGR